MASETAYIDLYNAHQGEIKRNCADALNSFRDRAFEDFKRLGFPVRTEDYRYTDLVKAYAIDYGLNLNRLTIPVANPADVFRCDVPGISAHPYFVVNDMFLPPAKTNADLPEGVIVDSLNEAARKYPELVGKYYGKQMQTATDTLQAFNGAFAQDGFFLYVPKNTVLTKPVQLINMMRGGVDFMATAHNLIILEEDAQAKLLVCDHTMDDVRFLSNRVTEVFVGENAVYEHYKVENTHNQNTNLCTLLIDQKASSHVLANVITLHNGLTRNNVRIALNGEHAEALLYGMAIGDKAQHVDNSTFIDHAVPRCTSNECFKYVLDDSAHGVFSGRVLVHRDAQKTAAMQTNRNICLSREALMNTKPQLEIYADDVKCSHGATVGQLDDTALFYLRSRGISPEEARLLLMFAFVNDVLENVRVEPLRDRIKLLVEKRFRGEMSKCTGCVICK